MSVIIAALVLFFGIEFLKGINLFRPANYYYAYYSNVDGLAVASPGQVNGYKVGQVREIIYDYADPGKIKVMLAMDKKLSIPADSYAEMGQTMLSGAYINLKIGKSAKKLAVGEEIPSGTSNGMMESISNEIMPAISQIMPKIDSLLSNLNTLVADPALLQSIQRLDGITANVLGVTEGLSNTMSRDVPLVVRDARSITHQIDSVSANLLALSKTLKQLPIATTMANVNDIPANLSNFATKLNSSTSTLGRLTNDDELYHRLNQVSADIDSLIVDIKRNPKRYISIKLL